MPVAAGGRAGPQSWCGPTSLRRCGRQELESYGDRVQLSLFVGHAHPAKILRLQAALTDTINQGTDSILLCDLGTLRERASRSLDVIGQGRPITGHGPAIL
ncbi:CRISPR-associated endonuclease Cas2 [Micromonospora sp. LOL_021]|uniref:CRISPR-associated endonuclease Cas2 n=1 Tax=Micromonospora sp. LOL_021 TaxID=3345417 RepID=UPI003A85F86E